MIRYVERDPDTGLIKGDYTVAQPDYAEEAIDIEHPDFVEYQARLAAMAGQ
jgi:hypothetical protein